MPYQHITDGTYFRDLFCSVKYQKAATSIITQTGNNSQQQ